MQTDAQLQREGWWHWFWQDIWVGAVTALILSALYLGIILVLLLAILLWNTTHELIEVLGIMLMQMAALLLGLILGVLPACLLGSVTGVLIAAALHLLRPHLTRLLASGIGLALAATLTVLLNLLVWVLNGFKPWDTPTYLLFLGIPTLCYLPAGAWMGWRLFGKLARPR